MDKHAESILASEKYLANADHLLYVTYNVIKEKKLLLNVLENLYKALLYGINAVLTFEHETRHVRLYNESSRNLQIFKIVAKNYNITSQELGLIDEIMLIIKKHKESGLVFTRGEKVVIMVEDKIIFFDLAKTKEYIQAVKIIISKIKKAFGLYMY
jgi:gamma-glutamyl:cysteine ligase YbdK (ATP-grasp superfamily)